MDIWIIVFTTLTIISGAVLSFLGIAGGLKNHRSLGLWILYITILFALTWAFLYVQKNIWETEAAETKIKERAELFIGGARMAPLEPGKSQKIVLSVRNKGKLAARSINLGGANNRFLPKSFTGPLQFEHIESDTSPDLAADAEAVIAVDAPMGITKEKMDLLNKGDLLFFHYGKGEYSDDLGGPYPIDFCFMYTPLAPTVLRTCPLRYWPKGGGPTVSAWKRPTLTVEGANLVKLPDGGGYMDVSVRNSGEDVARNATVNTTLWGIPIEEGDNSRECPEPHQAPLETMQSVGIIGVGERRSSGTGIILTPKEIANIEQGKTLLYVYLVSDYEGSIGKYLLEFYARYDPLTRRLHECPSHNKAT